MLVQGAELLLRWQKGKLKVMTEDPTPSGMRKGKSSNAMGVPTALADYPPAGQTLPAALEQTDGVCLLVHESIAFLA